jgi:molecular chaperone GrpE
MDNLENLTENTTNSSETSDSEQMRTELETVRADLSRQQELVVRTLADLDNVRKRAIRERDEWRTFAVASLIEALLPVFDAWKMGLDAAVNHPEAAETVKGLLMAYDQMQRVLSDHGVTVINPLGQSLDPHSHECVAHQPKEGAAEDEVIQVVRVGYKLGEKLLRPATVIVASGQ